MRLLHVTPYFEDAWAYGGIPRVVGLLSRAQAEQGLEVTVLTTDAQGPRERARAGARGGAVSVHALPNVSNRLAYHLQFFTPRGLGGWLDERLARFDVVHVHGCHHWLGAQVARRATGRPRYVLSPHGTAPLLERRRLAKRLFDLTVGRHVLPRAEIVLAVSEAERRQLEALGVAPGRVRVVPNPVEPLAVTPAAVTRFRARFGLGDARVVLFVAKLTPRKGADTLLHAFAQAARAGERLVIAGNDLGEGRRLEAMSAELGLRERVVFTGLLEGEARGAALGAASVFALPSAHEVFGLAAAEALLAGVPCVVGDDSGCGELVAASGGGATVPPGDVGSLARALRALLDDGEAPARAQVAGRWVAAQTAPQEVARRALELLVPPRSREAA
jgi:glycosyltransferase involved in cell wall biosynthesis